MNRATWHVNRVRNVIAPDVATDDVILVAVTQDEWNRNDYRVCVAVLDRRSKVESFEFHFPPSVVPAEVTR